VDDSDADILKKLQRNTTNPMGNTADLSLLFTAVNENMDYLVTDDKDFENLLENMSKDIPNKLVIKPTSSLLTDF
jgi:ABC-type antimicrobial peptide transport system permease subunit